MLCLCTVLCTGGLGFKFPPYPPALSPTPPPPPVSKFRPSLGLVLPTEAGATRAQTAPLDAVPFDEVVDRRGTGSIKWEGRAGELVGDGTDVIALWVADMDFVVAQPITHAIMTRAAHGIFGYTGASKQLVEATLKRLEVIYKSHGLPTAEWIRWQPGLAPGLSHAVRATCLHESDQVNSPPPPPPPPR